MPAAALHVVRDQPRHRRDVAVPRPPGFIGMTVVTCPAEHRGERRRRRFGGQKIVNDRRVRARRISQLQHEKAHDQHSRKNPIPIGFHSIHRTGRRAKCSRARITFISKPAIFAAGYGRMHRCRICFIPTIWRHLQDAVTIVARQTATANCSSPPPPCCLRGRPRQWSAESFPAWRTSPAPPPCRAK